MTPASRRARALAAVAIALTCLVAGSRPALALNPAMDISQYAHTAWRIRDGFINGHIDAIAQTLDGYLWLGTEIGLFRFDGINAVKWQPPTGQQLPSSNITRLITARDGALWIGTERGLARWKAGRLTPCPELNGVYIGRIVEDSTGEIWTTVFKATWKLCVVRSDHANCYDGDQRPGENAIGLFADRMGNVWVGTSDGVWRWSPEPRQFLRLPWDDHIYQGIAEDGNGALLLSVAGEIRRFAARASQRVCVLPGGETSNEMLRDGQGSLWVGTPAHGLFHLHNGRTNNFRRRDGLSGDTITDIFEDRENSIWVVTNEGLDRFREFPVSTFSQNEGLSNGDVVSVLSARDGTVWIATFAGLSRWKDGTFTEFTRPKTRPDQNHLHPRSMFEDDAGRIWIAGSDRFRYLQNDRLVDVDGLPQGSPLGIAEDTDRNMWFTYVNHGLLRLSPDGKVTEIPLAIFGGKVPWTVTGDPRGGIWIGFADSGLAYFARGQVKTKFDQSEGFPVSPVNGVWIEPDQTLWAATGAGLIRLRNGHLATLTNHNGLPCERAIWGLEDDDKSLWLGMACGVAHITRAELDAWSSAVDEGRSTAGIVHPKVLDAADGVLLWVGAGGVRPLAAMSRDGRLWFTGTGGLQFIDTHNLRSNLTPPPVHIEALAADGTRHDLMFAPRAAIALPARTRDVELDYAALSIVAPEKNQFHVKLEGWDADWIDMRNGRQRFYSNLPPRTYRFRVIASNNSGVWNEAGTYLDFSVDPAYYQTTWFRAGIVGTALLLLIALYRLRVRQVAHRYNLRLEERVNERTRIARDLHDTLLQSFHAIVLQFRAATFLLPEGAADARKAFDGVIDDASKAIVDARNAVQGLRSSTDPATTVVDAIAALAKELEAENTSQSRPEFVLHVEGTPGILQPLVRDDVYRIAREAMRNAFHHSGARRIEVDVRYDRRQFRLRIRDDGKGIDDKVAALGSRPGHYGLAGMRERAELVGGAFTLWSEPGSGTEIELTIPSSVAYAK